MDSHQGQRAEREHGGNLGSAVEAGHGHAKERREANQLQFFNESHPGNNAENGQRGSQRKDSFVPGGLTERDGGPPTRKLIFFEHDRNAGVNPEPAGPSRSGDERHADHGCARATYKSKTPTIPNRATERGQANTDA